MANETLDQPTTAGEGDSVAALRSAMLGTLGVKDTPPELTKPADPVAPVPEVAPVDPVKPTVPEVKPPDEKPADVKPLDDSPEDIKPPEKMTAKGKEGWITMNKELRDAKGAAKRLEEEVRQLKAAAPVPGEPGPDVALLKSQLDQAKQQLDENRRELASVRLERTPEFKRAYLDPMKAATDTITSLAKASQQNPRDFLDIADEPDATKRRERMRGAWVEIDEMDRNDLRNAVEALAQKKAESARVLQESTTAYETLETTRKTNQEKEQQNFKSNFHKEAEKAFRATFAKLNETDTILKKIDGQPEWNKQIDAVLDLAIRVDRDPAMLTNHAARGQLIMQALGYEIAVKALQDIRVNFEKKIAGLETDNKKLTDTVARYVKGTPPAGGDTPPGPDSAPVDDKTDLATRVATIFDQRTKAK